MKSAARGKITRGRTLSTNGAVNLCAGSMVNRNDWIMSAAGSSLRKDFVPRQIGRHWVGLGGEWPRRCSSIDRFSWDGSDVIGKQAKMLRNFRVLSYRTTPYCFLSWAMVSVKACLQF